MKKTRLSIALMLALPLFLTTACWEEPSNEIPDGTLFYTGCPLYFFFVDENGADRIDFLDSSTYPTAFPARVNKGPRDEAVMSLQQVSPNGSELILYNSGTNSLRKDHELQLCYFQTYLWGKTPEENYMIYIYSGDSEDSLKVSYRYLKAGESGELPSGSNWGVKLTSMRYNDVEVLLNNENGKVFIEKPSQGGETVVHVGSI